MDTKDNRLYNQSLIRMDSELTQKLYNQIETVDINPSGIDPHNNRNFCETEQAKDDTTDKK